jgi:hypothetical protein
MPSAGAHYPDIAVQITGRDDNAYAIMGRVVAALRRGGVPEAEVDQFTTECRSGNYVHILQTSMAWVDVS